MKSVLLLLAGALAGAPLLAPVLEPATPQQDQEAAMREMMAKAAKYTQPGPEHRLLERFLGEWDVSAVMTMGGQSSPPATGTATTSWKVDGRWLESRWTGTIMGMPGSVYHTMGYDRLKQSYVWNSVGTYDTAMNHAEGDATRDGKALVLYGTLDEYLTGEHDKMVKYVYRFVSDDRFVLEVHDLPIGLEDTKVLEFTYTRKGAK